MLVNSLALVYVGTFCLLALGIICNEFKMKWYVVIFFELLFMIMVIIGTQLLI